MLVKGIEILKILSKYGKAYIVGGAVRDAYMNLAKYNDIDIATNVPMDKIEELFDTHDIGKNKEFGIVVIKYKSKIFEIAQFRIEDNYQNGRHPTQVKFVDSFIEDARRRDFTINSMGLCKDYGVYDFFGGKEDIKNKIIRTVGDPEQRFSKDYLRMLRAVRFSSRLGFKIDIDTFKAIKNHAHKIVDISHERITKELWKMAEQSGERFASSLETLKQTGLLKHILPEVEEYENLPQDIETHPEGNNVWIHIMCALRVNEEADPLINFAILLHDIGKTVTHEVIDGKNKYFKHEKKGLPIINEICDRLRLDNDTREAILFSTSNHTIMHNVNKLRPINIKRLADNKNWSLLKKVNWFDEASRGGTFNAVLWEGRYKHVSDIMDRYKDKPVKKIVNGEMVMRVRGITKPCAEIGFVIKDTTEWIVNNSIPLTEIEAIERYVNNVKVL